MCYCDLIQLAAIFRVDLGLIFKMRLSRANSLVGKKNVYYHANNSYFYMTGLELDAEVLETVKWPLRPVQFRFYGSRSARKEQSCLGQGHTRIVLFLCFGRIGS